METATNPDWDVAKIKLQPQSIEAERSVLGALLISSDSWDGVAEVVAAADFYRPEHRAIFRQIALLVDRGEPVDVITVADRLMLLVADQLHLVKKMFLGELQTLLLDIKTLLEIQLQELVLGVVQ